ncbi:MAG: ribosomal protein S18-alanine N-acetyltransferase [Euryarchaeota archaeon]|nr:ribosomal protein S18-alanine N-acetyltransferase [Euryarchaeota archaeon]
MIIIRKFQPRDFAGVIEIEHEQFSEHDPYLYMSLYELNADTFFVAEDMSAAVGFVAGITAVGEYGVYCRVFSIAVREAYQGLGVGTQLMKGVIAAFHQKNIRDIVLEVRNHNLRAVQFYQRLGFVVTGMEYGYYNDGEDAILMRHKG